MPGVNLVQRHLQDYLVPNFVALTSVTYPNFAIVYYLIYGKPKVLKIQPNVFSFWETLNSFPLAIVK